MYLHGNLAALEVQDGKTPDQQSHLHISHAQAGTLQLFDLGYFKQEYLRDIAAKVLFSFPVINRKPRCMCLKRAALLNC